MDKLTFELEKFLRLSVPEKLAFLWKYAKHTGTRTKDGLTINIYCIRTFFTEHIIQVCYDVFTNTFTYFKVDSKPYLNDEYRPYSNVGSKRYQYTDLPFLGYVHWN